MTTPVPMAPAVSTNARLHTDHQSAPTIAFYVHHHGRGHWTRCAGLAAHLGGPTIAFHNRSLEDHHLRDDELRSFDVTVVLDDDADPLPPRAASGAANDPTAGGILHWAPLDHGRAAERTAVIAHALARHRPDLVVVDVSSEMVLQCRLSGMATAVMRQHGDRTDLAHTLAYRSASFLLAPFPPALEDPATPAWVRAKTTYLGYLSSASATPPTRREPFVLVAWGRGGAPVSGPALDVLAAAAKPRRVVYAGPPPRGAPSTAVEQLGWVDDPIGLISRAAIVVGAASNNTIAEVAAAGAGLVVIPQERPFGEQHRHAAQLAAHRAAAVLAAWPTSTEQWQWALEEAMTTRRTLSTLAAECSQSDAARTIESLAQTRASTVATSGR